MLTTEHVTMIVELWVDGLHDFLQTQLFFVIQNTRLPAAVKKCIDAPSFLVISRIPNGKYDNVPWVL